jgi:hypothetical protein
MRRVVLATAQPSDRARLHDALGIAAPNAKELPVAGLLRLEHFSEGCAPQVMHVDPSAS